MKKGTMVLVLEDHSTMSAALVKALKTRLGDTATILAFDTPWHLRSALEKGGRRSQLVVISDLYLDKYPTPENPDYEIESPQFRRDTPEAMVGIVKLFVQKYLEPLAKADVPIFAHTRMREFLKTLQSGARPELAEEITRVLEKSGIPENRIFDKADKDSASAIELAPIVAAVANCLHAEGGEHGRRSEAGRAQA